MKQMKIILYIGIMLTLLTNASAQIPTTGLTGHWPFSGNTSDVSVNTNNATITGAASLTVNRASIVNEAYSFDGTSSYMTTNASFTQGAAAKSFSLWFKSDTLQRGWLISGGTNSGGNAFGLFLNSAVNGELAFHGNGASFDLSLGNIIQANVWNHVAITYDGTTVKGFVNGVNVASSAIVLNTSNTGIFFGGRQGLLSTDFFNGDIDEILVYDKELTAGEVSDIYNYSASTTLSYTGNWSFSGNTNDSSGNGNHATISNLVTLTADRNLNSNSAYDFDGVSGYMEVNTNFSAAAATKSFSLWFMPDSLQRGWIISGGNNIGGEAFGLFLNNPASGELIFHGHGSSFDMSLGNVAQANVWTHVVITYDGTTLEGYVDGVNVATKTAALSTSLTNILFGARQGLNSAEFFDGTIDDIGIYDRVLTPTEIGTLYNGLGTGVNKLLNNEIPVSIYPNPTTNQLNIVTTAIVESIEIYSLLGQLVQKESTTSFSVQNLDNGVYLLNIKTNEGFVSKQFIKAL